MTQSTVVKVAGTKGNGDVTLGELTETTAHVLLGTHREKNILFSPFFGGGDGSREGG